MLRLKDNKSKFNYLLWVQVYRNILSHGTVYSDGVSCTSALYRCSKYVLLAFTVCMEGGGMAHKHFSPLHKM